MFMKRLIARLTPLLFLLWVLYVPCAHSQSLPPIPGSPSYSFTANFLRANSTVTSLATYTFWRQTLSNGKPYILLRITPEAGKDMFLCDETFFDAVVDSVVRRTEFFENITGPSIGCQTISGPKTYIFSTNTSSIATLTNAPSVAIDKTVTFRVRSQAPGATGPHASLVIPPPNASAASGATAFNYSDAWYAPNEGGWGALISHHVDTGGNMFIAFFVYSDSGDPTWYFISGGSWNGNTFSGDIYRSTAPPGGIAALSAFNTDRLNTIRVGGASVLFTGEDAATMTYSIGGVNGSKRIARLKF
jgi:hypothetical protein